MSLYHPRGHSGSLSVGQVCMCVFETWSPSPWLTHSCFTQSDYRLYRTTTAIITSDLIPPSVVRSSQVPRCVYVCRCMPQHLQLPQPNHNHKLKNHRCQVILTAGALDKQQLQCVYMLLYWKHPGHRSNEKFPAL